MTSRPLNLCRSWLFVGGPDAGPETAAASGADAVILELEDFTPPEARAAARAAAPDLLAAWRSAGAVTAVRVNPLAGDGREDLAGVIAGAPQVVMLPKVGGPHHALAVALARQPGDAQRCQQRVVAGGQAGFETRVGALAAPARRWDGDDVAVAVAVAGRVLGVDPGLQQPALEAAAGVEQKDRARRLGGCSAAAVVARRKRRAAANAPPKASSPSA